MPNTTPDWQTVRDDDGHFVCEYSPRANRVRVVKRNGIMREAKLPPPAKATQPPRAVDSAPQS